MKCKTCNGLGRIKATEFIGVDEGLRDVVILCPTCGGKGEIELTEQEYIQTCNTEQLAECISDITCNCWGCKRIYVEDCPNYAKYKACFCDKEDVVEWLKQPRNS